MAEATHAVLHLASVSAASAVSFPASTADPVETTLQTPGFFKNLFSFGMHSTPASAFAIRGAVSVTSLQVDGLVN